MAKDKLEKLKEALQQAFKNIKDTIQNKDRIGPYIFDKKHTRVAVKENFSFNFQDRLGSSSSRIFDEDFDRSIALMVSFIVLFVAIFIIFILRRLHLRWRGLKKKQEQDILEANRAKMYNEEHSNEKHYLSEQNQKRLQEEEEAKRKKNEKTKATSFFDRIYQTEHNEEMVVRKHRLKINTQFLQNLSDLAKLKKMQEIQTAASNFTRKMSARFSQRHGQFKR